MMVIAKGILDTEVIRLRRYCTCGKIGLPEAAGPVWKDLSNQEIWLQKYK